LTLVISKDVIYVYYCGLKKASFMCHIQIFDIRE
jgi:hypothetical protein